LFPYSAHHRRDLIADRIADATWERNSDRAEVQVVTLAHCYRGGRFSGILWYVRQANIAGVEVDRFIACDLLKYSGDNGTWGYKDMDEGAHPYFYSCPLKYLELVPKVACEEWRAGVRAWHARQAEKRKTRAARC